MYTPLTEFDASLLNTTEAYIHRAAQFLAMIGKNYLPNQPDDSNANLGFDPKTSSLVGRTIDAKSPFVVSLNVPDWRLEISENGETRSMFQLAGKLKSEAFDWLKEEIRISGLDPSKLKCIDHYEVPQHEVDLGLPFQELSIDLVSMWLIMRHNANVLMHDLNEIVGIPSEIRIWPHHFDTGVYYELGEKKAIGAGWAIADTLCDHPYLYIYGWNGAGNIDYGTLPGLDVGKWLIKENWQGAVIESVELSSADNQHDGIKRFMKRVTIFLKDQLN